MRTIKKLGFHLVGERGASAFLTMLSTKQDIKVATDTILTPLVWRSQVHVSNHDRSLPKRTLPLEQSGAVIIRQFAVLSLDSLVKSQLQAYRYM